MYTAFPLKMLSLVACPREGAVLVDDTGERRGAAGIENGHVRCPQCTRRYPVQRGILRLLDEGALHNESLNELRARDEAAPAYDRSFDEDLNQAETIPTLTALEPLRGETVLELGCGTGRFTTRVVGAARATLAVDFSAMSLDVLAGKLDDMGAVGLVQADVTKPAVARGAFGRSLSTLVSNLPTEKHRAAMYQLAAEALRDDGVFIASAHHFGPRERMRGLEKDGRYDRSGIFRRLFTRKEMVREAQAWFFETNVRPIDIVPPFGYRLRLPRVATSRFLEHVPLVRCFGELLLLSARRPRRDDARRNVGFPS